MNTVSPECWTFALPGMGADHTMYSDAWRSLPESRFLDWPIYKGETSIEAVAERIIDEEEIPDGAALIGTSLGGIVACEIARIRKLRGLILIGSATRPEEISGLLRTLHPLVGLAPLRFIQAAAGKLPGELVRMFCHSDPEFIRAMCCAVFRWQGLAPTCIVPLRIHGRRDHVIPLPRNVHLVLDGGHLVAMTHAADCARFCTKEREVREVDST